MTMQFDATYNNMASNTPIKHHMEECMSQSVMTTGNQEIDDDLFAALEKELPAMFDRGPASKLMGGVLSPKTLSNADAKGTGPGVRMKLGKKIVYERASFISWLRDRVK